MVVPVSQEAAKQVRSPQDRAVRGGRTAEDDVVAAARAGVTAVDHEVFRTQARLPRLLVENRGVIDQLLPVVGRVDIDLEDAGVGSQLEVVQPVVMRRGVALDEHRKAQLRCRVFDGADQFEVILQAPLRRQEDVQAALRGSTQRLVRTVPRSDWPFTGCRCPRSWSAREGALGCPWQWSETAAGETSPATGASGRAAPWDPIHGSARDPP